MARITLNKLAYFIKCASSCGTVTRRTAPSAFAQQESEVATMYRNLQCQFEVANMHILGLGACSAGLGNKLLRGLLKTTPNIMGGVIA